MCIIPFESDSYSICSIQIGTASYQLSQENALLSRGNSDIKLHCSHVRRRYEFPSHLPTLHFGVERLPFHLTR